MANGPLGQNVPEMGLESLSLHQHIPVLNRVTRLIKGAFHERPPQPRYSEAWDIDVSKVTSYLDLLGSNGCRWRM